ncbi:phosphopantothenoylcysteine decarboxylase/phosphopantothenate--cysteine ligase [Lewinella marina]|uniref:Coenzyme A biosynthesis bifunctional protein CoaBC n=1 Tax=Neolewinella marina TaxID=438751 RepID=A0A2G0CEX2_9BACT|nr:bifunctional phosphopantothenoylcysteine decarboxylase/phosphopantothenate--cysteine ligase CoaBC [Neolewinella marina]NJB85799.1 phosphopantothenoylcysteine decarboxylase/phosphopantothenate--cysteine ligase [Neolewinella marina]PHK98531.1 bifunctional phosphopantothenoylcysteine decarboxylase/phosphopantothenate--cysteine ligase CoaBC [Neolewinella marina]
MSLAGKKIILGVSGSIAAYKAALIVRGLIREGAEVRVLMTRAATDFISQLTLSTLSRHPVTTSVHSDESWNNHVELGLWADVYLVAPATATTLAKLAQGICDSALVAVYLSARCPIFFAPAMDVDMWLHPATRANVERLQGYGNHLIDVDNGELASGLVGQGRLAEPERILEVLRAHFARQHDLDGRRILITAGPTHEDLDPVRYLGNRSTGKMGIALAEAAAARGASVDLILGPTPLSPQGTGINVTHVRTALEMHREALQRWPQATDGILCAAVADYRPETVAPEKIKKTGDGLTLKLVRNPDIAAELGQQKQPGQFLVGFALETENGVENARGKLERKGLDLIVLNSPRVAGAAFGHDTNQIQLIDGNKVTSFELKPKREVADDILDRLPAHPTPSP